MIQEIEELEKRIAYLEALHFESNLHLTTSEQAFDFILNDKNDFLEIVKTMGKSMDSLHTMILSLKRYMITLSNQLYVKEANGTIISLKEKVNHLLKSNTINTNYIYSNIIDDDKIDT